MLAVLPGCAFIDFKFACHEFACRQKKQKGNFYEKEKRWRKSRGPCFGGHCDGGVNLAAIPVGACISLSRERNNVTAEYYGSDDVYGVLDQVSMMVSEASNLVTIAEKYSETDLTLVDAVRTAQNAVKKAERPADKYAALNDLTTAVRAMYNQIKNIDMNEEDATYRESLKSNYNSDLDYLMRDDYNDKAAAFNDALHNSPAYALAKLVGIGDVELFA